MFLHHFKSAFLVGFLAGWDRDSEPPRLTLQFVSPNVSILGFMPQNQTCSKWPHFVRGDTDNDGYCSLHDSGLGLSEGREKWPWKFYSKLLKLFWSFVNSRFMQQIIRIQVVLCFAVLQAGWESFIVEQLRDNYPSFEQKLRSLCSFALKTFRSGKQQRVVNHTLQYCILANDKWLI